MLLHGAQPVRPQLWPEALMGVIVITHFPGKSTDFERVAKEMEDLLVGVSAQGRAAGAVHHCFAENTDGSVLVIDEWPDEESFHKFFDNQADIGKLAAAVGVTGPPSATSYRIIDTPDRF
jgi:hypothetical protein